MWHGEDAASTATSHLRRHNQVENAWWSGIFIFKAVALSYAFSARAPVVCTYADFFHIHNARVHLHQCLAAMNNHIRPAGCWEMNFLLVDRNFTKA